MPTMTLLNRPGRYKTDHNAGPDVTAIVRRPWLKDAVCIEADKDVFFPASEYGRDAASRRKIAAARAICAKCPVLAECRRDVLDNPVEHGVYAGLTSTERRRIRRHPQLRDLIERYAS